jgi:hypothetical protein
LSPPRLSRGAKSAKAAPAKAAKSRTATSRTASPGLWDEYHTLLALSFGAILLGAAMLAYVYFARYGGDMKASGGAASLSPAVTRSIS